MSNTSGNNKGRSCGCRGPGSRRCRDRFYNSEDFMVYCFKVLPCFKKYRHDWWVCPYAHEGETAKRRDPRKFKYVGVACPDAKQGRPCPRGDDCPCTHNVFEYWLHPTRFRTAFCGRGIHCTRPFCFFAHSLSEMRKPSLEDLLPVIQGEGLFDSEMLKCAQDEMNSRNADIARMNANEQMAKMSAQDGSGTSLDLSFLQGSSVGLDPFKMDSPVDPFKLDSPVSTGALDPFMVSPRRHGTPPATASTLTTGSDGMFGDLTAFHSPQSSPRELYRMRAGHSPLRERAISLSPRDLTYQPSPSHHQHRENSFSVSPRDLTHQVSPRQAYTSPATSPRDLAQEVNMLGVSPELGAEIVLQRMVQGRLQQKLDIQQIQRHSAFAGQAGLSSPVGANPAPLHALHQTKSVGQRATASTGLLAQDSIESFMSDPAVLDATDYVQRLADAQRAIGQGLLSQDRSSSLPPSVGTFLRSRGYGGSGANKVVHQQVNANPSTAVTGNGSASANVHAGAANKASPEGMPQSLEVVLRSLSGELPSEKQDQKQLLLQGMGNLSLNSNMW